MTVAQIAKKYKRDRSTVLRWIERGLFPNAEMKTSAPISYWVVPASDLKDFREPKPGPKKQGK